MKRILAGLVAAGLAVALAGCGTTGGGGNTPGTGAGALDLKKVKFLDPDKAIGINNVDGYPNLLILCYRGVAWVTTTRPDYSALTRAAEYDQAVCDAGYTDN